MGAFNMKLKWFPLIRLVRDGYVCPAMTLLSLVAIIAGVAVIGGIIAGEANVLEISMHFAVFGVPMSVFDDSQDVRELEQIAYQDQLTALRNRRGLIEDVQKQLNNPFKIENRTALLLLDLDRFKFINDTLGHSAGDRMLREISDRLSQLSTDERHCYRLGGDEFVIIWSGGPSFAQVDNFCHELTTALSQPYRIDKSEVEGGGSIGVSWTREADKGLGSILHRADMALYKAKSVSGSAHRFFCEQMEEESKSREVIKSKLREVIFNSEFDLEYQPTVFASDLIVCHYDICTRSHDPILGDFSNPEQLDILKESGLIVQFDRAVLERAMRDMSSWSKSHSVIVHLDSSQLLDPTFTEYFAELLEQNNLNANRFILAFDTLNRSENVRLVELSLDELVTMGVQIASHGFSGDISNFAFGKVLKNSYLILGSSWVKNIAHDESSLELLNNLIRLADCMNLRVILHGVEHAEQVKCLMDYKRLLLKGEIVGTAKQSNEL